MNTFRNLLAAFSLLLAGAAWAAEPVVLVNGNGGQNISAPNSIDIQQNSGSRCEARAVGNCGSCAVSCPVGQSASCKPGRAVGRDIEASCTTEPSCSCK